MFDIQPFFSALSLMTDCVATNRVLVPFFQVLHVFCSIQNLHFSSCWRTNVITLYILAISCCFSNIYSSITQIMTCLPCRTSICALPWGLQPFSYTGHRLPHASPEYGCQVCIEHCPAEARDWPQWWLSKAALPAQWAISEGGQAEALEQSTVVFFEVSQTTRGRLRCFRFPNPNHQAKLRNVRETEFVVLSSESIFLEH